jgi:transcriptional regulator with XRE-family HTH domain
MTSKLAHNLKKLLETHQISPSQLADKCALDRPRLSRLMAGKTINPQVDTLRPIAEFFNITIEQLIGDLSLSDNDAHGVIVPINRLLIPVIDWKNVPYWLDIKEQFIPKKTIDAKTCISKDSFALVVPDGRFAPKINQGSLIIIDPHAKPNNRDYVLIQSNEAQAITIQQYLEEKGEIALKAVGQAFKMTKAKKDCHYFGVIIEARLDLLAEAL